MTRFIGLAEINNSRKEKWLYACSIQPMRYLSKAELTAQPSLTTEFPYAHILQEFSNKYFFFLIFKDFYLKILFLF